MILDSSVENDLKGWPLKTDNVPSGEVLQDPENRVTFNL
jgi:hypothetical protein